MRLDEAMLSSDATAPCTGFVIVAAGSGTRLGADAPKALVEIGGRTLLEHALSRLGGFPGRVAVAIAAPAAHLDRSRSLARAALDAVGLGDAPLAVVAGGASRQSSVEAALSVIPDDCDVVLVHDAARALAPRSLAERVAGAVRATGEGVVPVLPVVDTIKRLDDTAVVETVDRATLGAAQTPQGFPADALRAAYRATTVEHTDDAALAAAAGLRVRTVEGDPLAFKVTRPDDLERATRSLATAAPDRAVALRIGIGTDVHAFDDDAPLQLACLHWPGEAGLSGHSDGDAVAHAICDALLSAAGLGDIGGMFGTDDPELAGAAGEVFLRRTRERLERSGMRIQNIAVQFTAQRPRFSPRRDEAAAALEAVLGAPVSISATTSDGLGFTGRREGLFAIATALVAVPTGQDVAPSMP